MESQILYESLTKPKADLDRNMNNTAGNCNLTSKPEIPQVENKVSSEGVDRTRNMVQTCVQPTHIDGVREGQVKSKLQEQLESPLVLPIAKRDVSDISDKHFSPRFDSESMKKTEPAEYNNINNGTVSAQPALQVQSSNLVVSTTEVKSETSSLASPGISSNRSSTASPLPSPGSSIASQEITSSKSLSNSFKMREKRRRRGSAWTDDETEYLMEVWAKQTEIIKQKGGDESVTCAPVYRLISRSMAEQGWEKTWEQCKTRIHTLKRAYKITKDEISEGCQTITYCRHFDKLEIISGDNAQITPGMLAADLEQKRKQRGAQFKGKKQPVRRKLTVGENPNLVKKANIVNSVSNVVGFSQFQGQNSLSSVVSAQSTPKTNNIWYPPLPPQQQQFQLQQQAQPQQSVSLNQGNQFAQQPLQISVLPTVPNYPFHVTPTSGNNDVQLPPYNGVSEVNNNEINVKSEKADVVDNGDNVIKQYEQQSGQWTVPFSQQPAVQTASASQQPSASQQSSAGNDLERMRLNLEMRKLEVERNKIEMEERQRREDRDHQYRMMQLLLFGLGQQNISQLLSGQGPDVTHAHGTDLSRALESGLVPGGSQKANEKGLSFSEL
ncbi:uncharacterized protein LOC123531607 [Mercenaria mercenaria]|uniref:uncharacterized protein LOC123531607 n=1 Tax=Mercenaria mercenaria TaxID=6596 RepID=UPI00234F2115|nr:uncharacterized protein LOC123531607 [Mercenaria mercenaria]